MPSSFYSMLSRMKYINRWGLMRNSRSESLSEHTLDTAVLAHALAILGVRRLGRSYDPERAAVLALYHDASEIITGDMPTPVKYHDETITAAYKQVEAVASRTLLGLLPADLRGDYEPLLEPKPEDEPLWRLVKAADKLSALIKCVEEERAGNREFVNAKAATLAAIEEMRLPELELFLAEFFEPYAQTLDEQQTRS